MRAFPQFIFSVFFFKYLPVILFVSVLSGPPFFAIVCDASVSVYFSAVLYGWIWSVVIWTSGLMQKELYNRILYTINEDGVKIELHFIMHRVQLIKYESIMRLS